MRPLLAACVVPVLLVNACAPSQEAQAPAPTEAPPSAAADDALPSGPGWTGLTEPEAVIRARRELMTEAERLMKPIDGYTVGEPADGATLRSNATTIEALLVATPHLFPPTTNLFDPAELEPTTTALPTIWQRFPAFLTFAELAEKAAISLSRAETEGDLRAASGRLRAACDTCHAGFMKPYTPPQVSDDDINFDFDSVLPKN